MFILIFPLQSVYHCPLFDTFERRNFMGTAAVLIISLELSPFMPMGIGLLLFGYLIAMMFKTKQQIMDLLVQAMKRQDAAGREGDIFCISRNRIDVVGGDSIDVRSWGVPLCYQIWYQPLSKSTSFILPARPPE